MSSSCNGLKIKVWQFKFVSNPFWQQFSQEYKIIFIDKSDEEVKMDSKIMDALHHEVSYNQIKVVLAGMIRGELKTK